MTVGEAGTYLRQRLLDARFDFARPNVALAWAVFKTFVNEPVESDGDDLIFQAADGDPASNKPGYLAFVRQFFHCTETDSSWAQHVTALFTCDANVQLGLCADILCGEDTTPDLPVPDLGVFFRVVERSASFKIGVAYPDWKFEVKVYAG